MPDVPYNNGGSVLAVAWVCVCCLLLFIFTNLKIQPKQFNGRWKGTLTIAYMG